MDFFSMDLLYILEDIRSPFLDSVFSVLTNLGGEIIFLFTALLMLWCVDKKRGYYLLTVGFAGIWLNQALKLIFRIPRPWVRDPDFTIVESARADAGGFSFPSGHVQNVTSTFGSIARTSKMTWVRVICIAGILTVLLSRMYLGVHTPADTLTSLAIGTGLIFLLHPLFYNNFSHRRMYVISFAMLVCSILYVVWASLYPWQADMDSENLADGIKNGYTMIGCVSGIIPAYHIDRKYICYRTEAPAVWQIIKAAAGAGIVIMLRFVLKAPLNNLLGANAGSAVRYFIITFFAAGIWPMTFRFLPKKKT